MSRSMDPSRRRLPRRLFLELALAAPLAAGCATSGAAAGGPPEPPRAAGGVSRPGDDPLRSVRAQPLPPDAEPAFVFRAAAPAFEQP